jgi:aminomethyltransferase
LNRTQLFEYHSSHGKLTEFAGYEMPLWYSTITEEHMAVRNGCGIFDVSHMGRFSVHGRDAARFLEGLVPTDVQSQPSGKAFYTLLLNEEAGIIDDLIIIRKADTDFLVVVNAANMRQDLDHMLRHSEGHDVRVDDMTERTVMIAVQGPGAVPALQPLVSADLQELKRFRSIDTGVLGNRCTVSRTGYTGEDGFEVIIQDVTVENPANALTVWNALTRTATPCGLGARDSLRLEAGYPLHGSDIDEKTNPFEAGLSWVVSADKAGYVGSEAVSKFRTVSSGYARRGIVLDEGIPRHGFGVLDAQFRVVGQVTSGTFSPILRKGIALARVRKDIGDSSPALVEVRGERKSARYVKPPFYDETLYGWKRQGKSN